MKPTNQSTTPPQPSELILPTKNVPVESINPSLTIIFSKPKVGKTTLLAQLPDCLLIDLEKGSLFVEALKIKANNITELFAIEEAIIKAGKPYKHIALDTVTALEELCIPYAEHLYSKSPMGSSWLTSKDPSVKPGKQIYGNILNLPNGGGYSWLRIAFDTILNKFRNLAPSIILLAHVKDILLDKAGAEFNSMELDLTGKIKRMTASKADAIGYLYRKGDKNILSFVTSDEISCGSRIKHLRDKEIVISEKDKDENIQTYWDKIFI